MLISISAKAEAFEVLGIENSHWDPLVKTCMEWHPFYLSGFAAAEAVFRRAKAKLLVYRAGDGLALYPVLEFPFISCGNVTYDLCGLLYAGPISNTENPLRHGELIAGLRKAIRDAAPANGWVTDFCRLNPAVPERGFRADDGLQITNHVYVDLTLGYERIWKEYASAARRNVKRFRSSGVQLRLIENETEYEIFIALYRQRMRDLGASGRYCFDREYFRTLFREGQGHFIAAGAFLNGKLIGGKLSVHGNGSSFSYLLAVDQKYRHFRLSNGLNDFAIREGIRQGARRYVLGGGVNGEDGVFAYKKSLSSRTFEQIRISTILDPERYERLCEKHAPTKAPDGFFPPYKGAAK